MQVPLIKGGQNKVTEPIIVAYEMPCKLLYIKVTGSSWPYLISKILVVYNHTTDADAEWPHAFFSQVVFI